MKPVTKEEVRLTKKFAEETAKAERLTKKVAETMVGALSKPSKMPGFSYGLPAEECITGKKLQQIPGSVCANCYALKGFYQTYAYVVKPAQYKHLSAIDNPKWIEAMQVLIRSAAKRTPFFRWHDSGDLQSVEHLRKIVAIAVLMPDVRFWLPTREYAIVREYLASGAVIPSNLVVRVSAHMVDGPVPNIGNLPKSSVHSKTVPVGAQECIARYQDGECRDCRACWDASVDWVSYHEH